MTHDFCAYHKEGKLQAFNVAMVKTIFRHFEVPFRAKDRKIVNGGYPRMQLLKRVDCPFYQTKGTTIFLLVTESIKQLVCKS